VLTIATSRYFARQKVIDPGLAPVGTTTGAPRFPLEYELAGKVGMLAPYGLRSIEDWAEFETAYRARLDRFGAEKMKRVLSALADAAGADSVVLLCYEDLTDEAQHCHRTIFAAWWHEQTASRSSSYEAGTPGPLTHSRVRLP
jgi:hypothetical protein